MASPRPAVRTPDPLAARYRSLGIAALAAAAAPARSDATRGTPSGVRLPVLAEPAETD